MTRTLIWFRNDLRLHDHEPLTKAVESGQVLPLFCFDPRQFEISSFGFPKTDSYRARFLLELLSHLRDRFLSLGGDLVFGVGKPEQIIPELVKAHKIDQVFAHKEITSEETWVEDLLKKEGAVVAKG